MHISMTFLIIFGVLFVALIVSLVVLLISNAQNRQNAEKKESLESTLREMQSKADRFESLAQERKTEVERLNNDHTQLHARLEKEVQAKTDLSTELAALKARSETEQQSAHEKITLLGELRAQMEEKFNNMANEALKAQGEQFSKTNIERLEATLTPLREHVSKFETELKEINKETIKERENLKSEVQHLNSNTQKISQEAVALTNALKGDVQKQGAWGERILENILEKSGLRQGEEYEIQASRIDDEGKRLRPDVIIRMPENRTLIIDSKVSLIAYTEAVNAEDDTTASAARKRHVTSMQAHIKTLSSKEYQRAEENSVDYVIMFIPIEGAWSEALREDSTLAESALEKNVTIATPASLMITLRTVAHIWTAERRNKNAEKIADSAGKIYDKLANFMENMDKVGKALKQADNHYQKAFGQLSTGRDNLVNRVQRLKELGAKTQKTISLELDESSEAIPLEQAKTLDFNTEQ